MKSIIVAVAFLAVAVRAVPVQSDISQSVTTPVKNETLPVSVGTCGVADLDKIQEKITEALEKQISQLLGGHALKPSKKTRRATSSAAAVSRVNPDGSIKTTAAAKGSNDVPEEVSTVAPILTNAHSLPPVPVDSTRKLPEDGGAGAPGAPGDLPPPPPPPESGGVVSPPVAGGAVPPSGPVGEPSQPVPPPAHEPIQPTGAPPVPPSPPIPPHPIAGTGNTVQKVSSKANAQTGTAVASAIAKRAAVLQNVDTSGAKAIANAEAHKGAATNVQTVNASGTNVGIANAVVDNKNAANGVRTGNEPDFVLQNVAATGSKAVATAANNKGVGSGVQTASATGDEMSIASVTSTRAKRELLLITRGRIEIPDDGSYKPNPFEDDGSYRPEDDRILKRIRVARSPCISTRFDDNLRKLIRQTVADTFVELKKDLNLTV